MKVFQVNEYEFWAGRNEEEVKKAFSKMNDENNDPETFEDFEELYEFDLDNLKFFDEDTNERRTFREQLDKMIADGVEFPCSFAATE